MKECCKCKVSKLFDVTKEEAYTVEEQVIKVYKNELGNKLLNKLVGYDHRNASKQL